jgi:uncharacterized Zn-binding protein involved in type VI secretion
MANAVVRLGDQCTGHGCFPPRVCISASNNVIVNGIGAHRVGDSWAVHCCGIVCHGGNQANGSSTVFVNGQKLARIGDSISCGSKNAQGSPNVFAG